MRDLGPDDPREIGGHRLLRRIGAGGMGVVYLGRAPGGGLSAVKVVRAEFADDEEFRARFRREATAAGRVHGPFTARVLDARTDGPVPWMATEYIPGLSLDRAVREVGGFRGEPLRMLASGLAEALRAIHAAGLVHRDLKPSNVLLCERGPQVIDFGIARAADATALTGTGQALGTPGYMAPEQVTGGDAGPLGDIFAFGGVLLYAATGRRPFGGGDPMAVLDRSVREEPDLSGLEGAVAELVRACLAKDPADRPDLDEVRAALAAPGASAPPDAAEIARTVLLPAKVAEGIARGAAEADRIQRTAPPPWAWAGAAALAVVMLAVGAFAASAGGLLGGGRPGAADGGGAAEPLSGGVPTDSVIGGAGETEAPRVADGLAGLECSGAHGPLRVHGAAWVGYGPELLMLSDYGLSLFDTEQGEETARLSGGDGACHGYGGDGATGGGTARRMDVSDDGRIAVQVAPGGGRILAWDLEAREELAPIEVEGGLADPVVAVSGDGGTVAVTGGDDAGRRRLEVFRTEGGEPLLSDDSPYFDIDLDADGGRLAAVTGTGPRTVALLDTGTGRREADYAVREPSGDRSSSRVAFGQGDLLAYTTGGAVVVWNPDTESVLQEFPYTPNSGPVDWLAFTGDSTVALAFSPQASNAPGGLVRRWSVADGSEMSSLEGAGWRFPAFHPSAPDRAPEVAAFRTPAQAGDGFTVALVRPESGRDATRWLPWGPADLGGFA
ncbi:WD40 repeat domain-containing serine/threonine protein kinase [Nocardiopsis suaedae]|uniref:WD40 repeat domain-containing serine/threonine protein kinase n=1 Tax=Nocardiopsis suaedae TaxID=3018444 RepID=A0ABT4TLE1_9ACTN|nr:WD40 repeat domain-containing serine/threonine protein kinase [Nocardiopsis suaedae]MDA2805191.1 WD40 repeat domain-containing serine/threonine protein kinase [Nocardiopsis suaedae]